MATIRPRPALPVLLKLPLVGMALAAALTVLVYLPAARSPLLFDDTSTIDHNPSITKLWPPSIALEPPLDIPTAGRPVANYSLALNYALNDLLGIDQRHDPEGPGKTASYHILNILVHVTSGLLLFGIIRRTLRSGRFGDRWVLDAGPVALAVSAIWLLHPIQTEAVDYLSQRTELLVSLCYLATLYCNVRSWEATTIGRRRGWCVAAVVACLLGMGSKEVMVSAPLMIVLYDRAFQLNTWGDLRSPALRGRCWFYAALLATLALLVALIVSSPRQSAGFSAGMSSASYLITQGWAIPHYLLLVFWPAHFTIDYGQHALPLRDGVVGLVALSALGVATLVAWRRPNRWGWLGFCGAWFFAILAPSSSFLPIATEIAAERRIYLAFAAVVVVFVVGMDQLIRRVIPTPAQVQSRRAIGIATSLLVAVLALLTLARSNAYRNPELLWRDAIASRSDNARAWNNLGGVLAAPPTARTAEADSSFRHAVHLDSSYVPALFNLANSAISQHQFADAEQLLRRVIAIDPHDEPALTQLGGVMALQGDPKSAVLYLERAIALDPDDSAARSALNVARAMLLRDSPQRP